MKLPASLLLDVMLDKRQAGSRHQCEGVVLSEDGMETSDHGQGHESGSVDLFTINRHYIWDRKQR
jgi:hypothetical protein